MTVFLHRGKFDLLALLGINGNFLKSGFILTIFNNRGCYVTHFLEKSQTGGLNETKLQTIEKQLRVNFTRWLF